MNKIKLLLLCVISIFLISSLSSCVIVETARFTVTEQEWEMLTKQDNYTLEFFPFDDDQENMSIQKYTSDAIQLDSSVILFIEDKQYKLIDTEYGWYASDVTILNFEKSGLLEGKKFEDYTYNEKKLAYIGKPNQQGMYEELYFVNGELLKKVYVSPLEEPSTYYISEVYYSNIGSTEIEIPEYSFTDYRRIITEEIWNKYANEYNYYLECYYDYIFTTFDTQYSTKDAWLYNDTYYVEKEGVLYKLVEEESGYVGIKEDNFPGVRGPLLQGISFDEVEYDDYYGGYVTKNVTSDGLKYIFYFFNGEIAGFDIVNTLSTEYDIQLCYIYTIGEVELDIPEFTIKEEK